MLRFSRPVANRGRVRRRMLDRCRSSRGKERFFTGIRTPATRRNSPSRCGTACGTRCKPLFWRLFWRLPGGGCLAAPNPPVAAMYWPALHLAVRRPERRGSPWHGGPESRMDRGRV